MEKFLPPLRGKPVLSAVEGVRMGVAINDVGRNVGSVLI
jgi:hypothetical protein